MEKVIDIRPVKRQMRASTKEKRLSMDAEIKSSADKKICNKLLNLWSVREAETVLCYVSTPIEVDTREFINALLKSGKTVAVPRCSTKDRTMDFYIIKSYDDLQKGAYGLLEPDVSRCKRLDDFDCAVCIVPGLAFDCEGYRLGFGKGYYDRFLQHFGGVKVGICYKECVTWQLPHGRFDKAVDIVLTQRYIRNIKK